MISHQKRFYLRIIAGLFAFAMALTGVTAWQAPLAHASTTSYWTAASNGWSASIQDHNAQVNLAGKSQDGLWSGAQATTTYQMARHGTLNLQLVGNNGENCQPGMCTYGTGDHKAVLQMMFDGANWYEIGILSEGYVTYGPQIIVRGMNRGQMFQGIYPLVDYSQQLNNASIIQKMQNGTAVDIDQQHYIRDYRHIIKAQWSSKSILFIVDNTRRYGPYYFSGSMNGPAATMMAAGKNPGDSANATFTNINFSGINKGTRVFIPEGKPYASISANLMNNGAGRGFNAYIRLHDEYGSAAAAGIQTDRGAPETGGKPWIFLGRMEDGIFDYDYVKPSDWSWHNFRIEWWADSGWAVVWYDGRPIANLKVNFRGRLYASVEGDGANNGDYVHAFFSDVETQAGNASVGDCGFYTEWTPTETYGLHAKRTANRDFEVEGIVGGVPAGKDWDTTLIAGSMITWQFLPENGQGNNGGCMTESWSTDPAHRL